MRAPKQLLNTMETDTRSRLITALETERKVEAPSNNWLLFAALNEALLRRLGVFWDQRRVDYALREHQSWYLGDGTYGDGPQYHADFYNSFVIHPFLLSLMDELQDEPAWKRWLPPSLREHAGMLSSRSAVSRLTASFLLLAARSLIEEAPFTSLRKWHAAAFCRQNFHRLRCDALSLAVQQRTLNATGTFSAEGWLQIGLAGHQPSLAKIHFDGQPLSLLCRIAAIGPWLKKCILVRRCGTLDAKEHLVRP